MYVPCIYFTVPMENLWHGHKMSVATDRTYGRGCHFISRKRKQSRWTRQPSSSPSLKTETRLLTLVSKSNTKNHRRPSPSPALPLGRRCLQSASIRRRQGTFRGATVERRHKHYPPTFLSTLPGSGEEVGTTARVLVRWMAGTSVLWAWVTSALGWLVASLRARPSWTKSAAWWTVSLPTSVSWTPWCCQGELLSTPPPPLLCQRPQMPPSAHPSTSPPGADRPPLQSPHTLRWRPSPISVTIDQGVRFTSTWLGLAWAADDQRIWRSWWLWHLRPRLETPRWVLKGAHPPRRLQPPRLNMTNCCWNTSARARPLSNPALLIPCSPSFSLLE